MPVAQDPGTYLASVGGVDPISPVSVGREIAFLLPNAKLHIVYDHNIVMIHETEVAPLIDLHLANPA